MGTAHHNILRRIQRTMQLQKALAAADLVIDNAPENLEIKRALFAKTKGEARPQAGQRHRLQLFDRVPSYGH